jgi:MFS family permease
VLLAGLGAFGVTSLAAGLSRAPLMLIVSRFAQGASAAFVAPQALAIITDLFAEGPARPGHWGSFRVRPQPVPKPGSYSAAFSPRR